MVTYDKNEKDLVIPSALGLAGMQDSVCGVTEQEVIEIVESAITDYDTEIQVDLEDIRENVSGNTDDIAALSAATEALEQRVDDISTSALTEQIEALSGSVEDIRSDVETLSGDTDNIRSDVAALSAVTSGIAIDVETAFKSEIGLRSDLTSLSGRTSAITEQVSELSASTSGLSADVAALSTAMQGKQDTLTAGDGIDISGATISVKAGEGLGFSGDTLVVSGISGLEDIPHYVYLSTGSGQTDLYDDIVEAYDAGKKIIMEAIDVENRSSNGKVYLDLTKVITATTTAGTVVYAGFVFSGEGLPNSGNGLRIFKVTVNRIGYGGVSGTQTANNIYYASKNEMISNYTLPTAAANTKGGIKIGSGVTMSGDFLSVKYGDGLGMSGDTLVVSGGTGGGDYLVVDALSAVTSPEEGQMAVERTSFDEVEYQSVYVEDETQYTTDGYWAAIYNTQDSEWGERSIYRGGDGNFYWDYDNGYLNKDEWAQSDWNGEPYKYRLWGGNGVLPRFDIIFPENSPLAIKIWDHEGEEPIGIALDTEAVDLVSKLPQPNLYQNDIWAPLEWTINKKTINELATSAETNELISKIRDMVSLGRYPKVLDASSMVMLDFVGDSQIWLDFQGQNGNTNYHLYISNTVFDDNGFNSVGIRYDVNPIFSDPSQSTIGISSAGTINDPGVLAKFSEESHTDTIIFRWDGDYGSWGQAPIKYVYRTRAQEEDPLVYHFCAEVPINGTLYRGVWHATEWDWDNYTLDSWTTL